MSYDINKSVSVTGHRVLSSGFDKKELENTFDMLIKSGYENFYVGMALGFDSVCFEILSELKKTNDIKIIACLPCEEQDELWNKTQKKKYREYLSSADEKIVISEKYMPTCMNERNKYMVDNSSVLVAYIYRSSGGAYNTVKYALEKQKYIIYIK